MKKILVFTLTLLGTSLALAQSENAVRAMDFFKKLDSTQIGLVDTFYDKDVDFQDPIHHLHSRAAVKDYYAKLYKNVQSIRFEFSQNMTDQSTVVLVWKMFLATPGLNAGREFSVDGNSVITFGGTENKVVKHRDYFDMGEFVYERLAVLKTIIGFIKNKLDN